MQHKNTGAWKKKKLTKKNATKPSRTNTQETQETIAKQTREPRIYTTFSAREKKSYIYIYVALLALRGRGRFAMYHGDGIPHVCVCICHLPCRIRTSFLTEWTRCHKSRTYVLPKQQAQRPDDTYVMYDRYMNQQDTVINDEKNDSAAQVLDMIRTKYVPSNQK